MSASSSVIDAVKDVLAASNPGLATREDVARLEERVEELEELVERLAERLADRPAEKPRSPA